VKGGADAEVETSAANPSAAAKPPIPSQLQSAPHQNDGGDRDDDDGSRHSVSDKPVGHLQKREGGAGRGGDDVDGDRRRPPCRASA
jgi:hypothetical protein